MSKPSSTTRLAPSSGEGSEPIEPAMAEHLLDAGRLLADSGVFAFVWLDRDLRVAKTFGRLADFVTVGRPATDSIIALVGLESAIAEVALGRAAFVDLPAVAIRETDAPETRLNLTFYWMARSQMFLLLVSRALPRSNLEHQLTHQMRARLMAEADARALAKRLAVANRDLEEFASIISHDLRAPMRALRYLVEDVEAAVSVGRTDDLDVKLHKVITQSQRMSDMLGALFEYSSTGYKALLQERTDTRQLAERVVAHAPRAADFLVTLSGDWPVIETVAAPLELVLTNLVENAMKYHDQAIGSVEISADDGARHVIFTVRDDGPGIPSDCQGVVFLPFRRLDPEAAVEGSGMGLALVKRTVERIGGRIELISPVVSGRGTAFRVHWPKIIAAAETESGTS
jgi:signal transduction histidine kinase